MIWKAPIVCTMATLFLALGGTVPKVRAADDPAVASVAFLGVLLQNDNEGLDPTSDAERARQQKVEDLFKSTLEATGRYKFVPVTDDVKKKMAAGQHIGQCAGCELQYGKDLGADAVAWVEVQKISNLILNMNVYMAGTADPKLNYVHSVDIRGNTDESWTRSLTYLLKNYFLPPAAAQK